MVETVEFRLAATGAVTLRAVRSGNGRGVGAALGGRVHGAVQRGRGAHAVASDARQARHRGISHREAQRTKPIRPGPGRHILELKSTIQDGYRISRPAL